MVLSSDSHIELMLLQPVGAGDNLSEFEAFIAVLRGYAPAW